MSAPKPPMSDTEYMDIQSREIRRLRDALRALNSAIWLDHPEWAITSPDTAKAAEILGLEPKA